uniref:Transmembrane protein n=1 Tax=Glossina pallidipes TaxID=7398 RepID=A0A1A9ZIR9_GLOPL
MSVENDDSLFKHSKRIPTLNVPPFFNCDHHNIIFISIDDDVGNVVIVDVVVAIIVVLQMVILMANPPPQILPTYFPYTSYFGRSATCGDVFRGLFDLEKKLKHKMPLREREKLKVIKK